ncbi:hypothetical protein ADUPG1_007111, partial [Aduncisulcus paluster]
TTCSLFVINLGVKSILSTRFVMEEYHSIVRKLYSESLDDNPDLNLTVFLENTFSSDCLDLSRVYFTEYVLVSLILPLLKNKYFQQHVKRVIFPESIESSYVSMPECSAFDYNGNRLYPIFPSRYHAPPLCLLIDMLIILYNLRLDEYFNTASFVEIFRDDTSIADGSDSVIPSSVFSFTSSHRVLGMFCDNYQTTSTERMTSYIKFLGAVKNNLIVKDVHLTTGKANTFHMIQHPYFISTSFDIFKPPYSGACFLGVHSPGSQHLEMLDRPLFFSILSLACHSDFVLSEGLDIFKASFVHDYSGKYSSNENFDHNSDTLVLPRVSYSYPPLHCPSHIYEAVYSTHIRLFMKDLSEDFLQHAIVEQERRSAVLKRITLSSTIPIEMKPVPRLLFEDEGKEGENEDEKEKEDAHDDRRGDGEEEKEKEQYGEEEEIPIASSLVLTQPVMYECSPKFSQISFPSAMVYRDIKNLSVSTDGTRIVKKNHRKIAQLRSSFTPCDYLDLIINHFYTGDKSDHTDRKIDCSKSTVSNPCPIVKMEFPRLVPVLTKDVMNILEYLKNWYFIEEQNFSTYEHRVLHDEGVELYSEEYTSALRRYVPFDFVDNITLHSLLSSPVICEPDSDLKMMLDMIQLNGYAWSCMCDIEWFSPQHDIFGLFTPILLAKITNDIPGELYIEYDFNMCGCFDYTLRSIVCRNLRISSLSNDVMLQTENQKYLMSCVLQQACLDLSEIQVHSLSMVDHIPMLDRVAPVCTNLEDVQLSKFVASPSDIVRLFTTLSKLPNVTSLNVYMSIIADGKEPWEGMWSQCGLFGGKDQVKEEEEKEKGVGMTHELSQHVLSLSLAAEGDLPDCDEHSHLWDYKRIMASSCKCEHEYIPLPASWTIPPLTNLKKLSIRRINFNSTPAIVNFFVALREVLKGATALKEFNFNRIFDHTPNDIIKEIAPLLSSCVFDVLPPTIVELGFGYMIFTPSIVDSMYNWAVRNDIRLTECLFHNSLSLSFLDIHAPISTLSSTIRSPYPISAEDRRYVIEKLLQFLIFVTSPRKDSDGVIIEQPDGISIDFDSCLYLDMIVRDDGLSSLFCTLLEQIMPRAKELSLTNCYCSIEKDSDGVIIEQPDGISIDFDSCLYLDMIVRDDGLSSLFCTLLEQIMPRAKELSLTNCYCSIEKDSDGVIIEQPDGISIDFDSCLYLDMIVRDDGLSSLFCTLLEQIMPRAKELSLTNCYCSIEFVKMVVKYLPGARKMEYLDMGMSPSSIDLDGNIINEQVVYECVVELILGIKPLFDLGIEFDMSVPRIQDRSLRDNLKIQYPWSQEYL